MTATRTHWKLGLFVSAGLLVGVGALLWLGAGTITQRTFPMHVFFDESVSGLEVGSPLQMRGVVVGTVSNIRFAPDRATVVVDVDVYEDAVTHAGLQPEGPRGPPAGFAVQLVSTGLTGGLYLSCDKFDPARYPRVPLPAQLPDDVDPRAILPSVVSNIETLKDKVYSLADSLPVMYDKLSDLVDKLSQLSATVNDVAGGEARKLLAALVARIDEIDVEGLSRRADDALQAIIPAMTKVDRAASAFAEGPDSFPALVARGRQLLTHLDGVLEQLDLPSTSSALRASLVSADMATGEVASLSRDAHGLTDQMTLTLTELRRTLDDLSAVLQLLDRQSGALVRGRHVVETEQSPHQ